jgi:protein-S-isoprenylcysteine O-methyltransferase
MALTAAMIEYTIEAYFFPSWKSIGWNVYVGFVMVLTSQCLRSAAMMTAGSNFNHYVQYTKDDSHVLVTHGVYKYLRHPAYTGFYYWGIGTQLMLWNPICVCLYAYALGKFFGGRIPFEEERLKEFFDDYGDYMNRTFVLIPY